MSTPRDMIKASLRLIGAISSGDTPSADESSDALDSMNRMLQRWSLENLMIFAKVREEFPMIASQQAYTMGTLGDFNTSRPIKIENAAIEIQGTLAVEIPINIVGPNEWAAIITKDFTSTLPSVLYPEGTNPLETLNLWPIPTTTDKLVLYSTKALTTFTSLNTVLTFPTGYEDAIVYNLAVRLAPEYGKQLDSGIISEAMEAKEKIKIHNKKPMFLASDSALTSKRGGFNWRTGQ